MFFPLVKCVDPQNFFSTFGGLSSIVLKKRSISKLAIQMAMRLEIYTFMMVWAAISRLNGLRVYGRKPATVRLYSVCSYTRSATTVHL